MPVSVHVSLQKSVPFGQTGSLEEAAAPQAVPQANNMRIDNILPIS
jgi:hypothetical protein